MKKNKENNNNDIELLVRNILIILTIVSIIILTFNVTYAYYQDSNNIESLNTFIVDNINSYLLWIDNILIYLFAPLYIIIGIKSKKEVLIKISFSILSIITTMIFITFIINIIAGIFNIF